MNFISIPILTQNTQRQEQRQIDKNVRRGTQPLSSFGRMSYCNIYQIMDLARGPKSCELAAARRPSCGATVDIVITPPPSRHRPWNALVFGLRIFIRGGVVAADQLSFCPAFPSRFASSRGRLRFLARDFIKGLFHFIFLSCIASGYRFMVML